MTASPAPKGPAAPAPGKASYTRFERARIVGARALQIALGAPILLEVEGSVDPVRIAHREFEEGIIPITVVRETRARRVRRAVRVARISEIEGAAAAEIEFEAAPAAAEEEGA